MRKNRACPPVPPNLGIEREFARRLRRMINAMEASFMFHVLRRYKRDEPEMAVDALAATSLEKLMDRLARQWQFKFNELGDKLGAYFARSAAKQSDKAMAAMLKRQGWTVEFKLTRAQRDVLRSIINTNVELIKSLPSEAITQLKGVVQRSVQSGYDQSTLYKALREQFGVEKKRAKVIAHEQTKQTYAQLQRVRQVELGVQVCDWFHSHGGRKPRPTHVAFGKDRSQYDPAKGMWDPDAYGKGKGAWIVPGQLINCRCMGRMHLPELMFKAEAA